MSQTEGVPQDDDGDDTEPDVKIDEKVWNLIVEPFATIAAKVTNNADDRSDYIGVEPEDIKKEF